MNYTQILILAAAVSVDSAAAGAALGSGGIRLPKISAVVISGTGALFLLMTAVFGEIAAGFIPAKLCVTVSKIILAAMGAASVIKYFAEITGGCRDGREADTNRDRTLSAGEAAVLAAGLSADSAVTGISAGLSGTDAASAALLFFGAFAIGFAAVEAGCILGRKLLSKKQLRTGWLSGAVLIILALTA